MIRALLTATIILAVSVVASAQEPVRRVGPVTPGNCALFLSPNQIQDGGPCASGAGVDRNVLLPVVSNTTIDNTMCGKTIQAGTGSTGYFTLTLPASVAGFDPTCSVWVENGDTANEKKLVGFPADFAAGSQVLWPLQSGSVKIVNGAWATGVNPGIYQAVGSVVINVNRTSGSDALGNGCLGTGARACSTWEHAWRVVQNYVRPGIAGLITIRGAAGEVLTENPAVFRGPGLIAGGGGGVVFFDGNGSTVTTASGWDFNNGAVVSIGGFTFKCSSGTALSASKMGLLVIGSNMVFDTCPGAHMQTFEGGVILADAGYTVSAIGNYHVIVNSGGFFSVAGKTIAIPNALSFVSWISANTGARASFSGTTFTGTGRGAGSAGSKYDFNTNASLVLSGAVDFPGATAGTAKSNACVDSDCASSFSISGNAPTQTQNQTVFCGIAYCGAGNPGSSIIVPRAGRASRLYAAATVTPAVGQTFTITLFTSGATVLSCTISNPAAACSDTDVSHAVDIAPGGTGFFFRVVLSATSGSAAFAYSIQYDSMP